MSYRSNIKKYLLKAKRTKSIIGEKCHYCRCVLTAENESVDHKIPQSKGGSDDIENLVLSCKPCNERKGNMDYDEFLLTIND